jgi:hypothetical protein
MKFETRYPLYATIGALSLLALGCESGGVGDPCTPEDEYHPSFSGFSVTEVNVESRSFQCETRVCLVNHFDGRVSCPYGQSLATIADHPAVDDPARCRIPGTQELVEVAVAAQLVDRQTDKAVYCSCRCDGPDPNARYCDCPSGYACTELVEDLGLGAGQLAGSYCVKDGTRYNEQRDRGGATCSAAANDCGNDGKNP